MLKPKVLDNIIIYSIFHKRTEHYLEMTSISWSEWDKWTISSKYPYSVVPQTSQAICSKKS